MLNPLKLAVIGHPISHSLSPPMQRAALKAMGIRGTYKKILVEPKHLKTFVKREARKLDGFNITLPHKEAILSLLDWVSPMARRLGAVNTVWRRENKLLGFNTDGMGYLNSLEESVGFFVNGQSVVMLGAGGAARALAFAMAQTGAKNLVLANRNLKRAKDLVRDLKKYYPGLALKASSLSPKTLSAALKKADLLVQTTSVGLDSEAAIEIPWQALKKGAWVSDIVYRPLKTAFLSKAQKLGFSIHTGEGMLAYQGALALEIWTGEAAPAKLMQKVLLKNLGTRAFRP